MNTAAEIAMQGATLSAHGLAMLLFAAIVFAVFIWDKLPIASVCLAILGILSLTFVLFPLQTPQGVVDPFRFFSGFGHPALVAISGLMVLGHGLVVTGALEPVARRLGAWVAVMPRLALLALLLGAAGISGLVNDTPVVVLLIPIIIAAAGRAGASAGTMLLPMNYAVLIGGMATTIGTSTNLIVVAIAASFGIAQFDLFSFYPLVAVAAIPALAYLWLVAPRLLVHVKQPAEQLSSQAFDAEICVEAGSWLDGRQLRDAFVATGHRLHVLDVRRNEQHIARLPSLTLRAGDRLLIQDTAANLKDFETSLKAKLHGVEPDTARSEGNAGTNEPVKTASAIVAQVIITPTSPLIGRSIREERIAERYGVVVVGLRPRTAHADWQRVDLTNRRIQAGDLLLMQGRSESMREVQHDGIGLLLDAQFTLPRQEKAGVALITMAIVVLLAATKTLPISLAAIAGVLTLLAARCLSWEDVTQSLSVKVILLVAASLALGDALELSGTTAWMAQKLASASRGMSPAWVLALLMALMGLLTNFVSNNASAAIGTPLGIELARSLGVPPEPFVLAVLFGCNLCYLTPMGYQTNLLVMNAGGYRFSDFTRIGGPLFIIMWAGLSYGLVLRYQL